MTQLNLEVNNVLDLTNYLSKGGYVNIDNKYELISREEGSKVNAKKYQNASFWFQKLDTEDSYPINSPNDLVDIFTKHGINIEDSSFTVKDRQIIVEPLSED